MAQGEKSATRARLLRFGIAIVALMCAFVITVYKSQGTWQFTWNPKSLLAHPEVEEGEYDLSSIVVLNRVLLQLQENYVDAERFDPKFMLAAGLNEIQKSEPQIVATFDKALSEGPDEVTLQVGDARQRFAFGDIESLWEMSLKFKEIFRFIQDNLGAGTDPHEIEYAAINGVLRTLDPHSVLLAPETYRAMLEGNRGNFGGLGIVIRMLEGDLTVMKPMGKDTPAGAAGIKKGDVIMQIDDHSTLNMDVSEAVELLRGAPGTSVDLLVQREGWKAPRTFTLERAEIKIPSVESAALGDGIGYIKLKGFQGNTHKDMVTHLERLEEEMGGLEGLVLDMRGNPGGLLEQAIQITDEFLTDGTIVTTVGSGRRYRKPYLAESDGTQPTYPIAVLIDPSSASASEIVAGALKNHDRAVILGDTSFGKGSVQVLYELQDGSALKLTIAQYLTPGDVSIQSVGIVPDVQLVPMTVKHDELDLYLQHWVRREANLSSHLDHESALHDEKPTAVLKYLAHSEPLEELAVAAEPAVAPEQEGAGALPTSVEGGGAEPAEGEATAPVLAGPGEPAVPDALDGEPVPGQDEEDALEEVEEELAPGDDPQVRVAVDLLKSAGTTWNRKELLASLQGTLDALGVREDERLSLALRSLGVDWSAGAMPANPDLDVRVTTNHPDDTFAAGDTVELSVTVTNRGSEPVHRIYGITTASTNRFEDREYIFGRIAPGESVTRTQTLTVGANQESRLDRVEVALFSDALEGDGAERELARGSADLVTRGPGRPHFAFAFSVLDEAGGNGDGIAAVGETVTLRLLVDNVGAGSSPKPLAYIRNLNGAAVFLSHGREQSEALAAGDRRAFDFTFEVKSEPQEADDETLEFEVHVYDRSLGRSLVEEIRVPLTREDGLKVTALDNKKARLRAEATLLTSPLAEATPLGEVGAGAELTALGRTDGWLRVANGDAVGWLPAEQVELSDGAPTAASAAMTLTYAGFAPRVDLEADAMVTADGSIKLRGKALDDSELRDLYVFVYSEKDHVYESRKVAYQRFGSATGSFEIDVPLLEGMNRIKVVTRDDDDLEVSDSVYVFRR